MTVTAEQPPQQFQQPNRMQQTQYLEVQKMTHAKVYTVKSINKKKVRFLGTLLMLAIFSLVLSSSRNVSAQGLPSGPAPLIPPFPDIPVSPLPPEILVDPLWPLDASKNQKPPLPVYPRPEDDAWKNLPPSPDLHSFHSSVTPSSSDNWIENGWHWWSQNTSDPNSMLNDVLNTNLWSGFWSHVGQASTPHNQFFEQPAWLSESASPNGFFYEQSPFLGLAGQTIYQLSHFSNSSTFDLSHDWIQETVKPLYLFLTPDDSGLPGFLEVPSFGFNLVDTFVPENMFPDWEFGTESLPIFNQRPLDGPQFTDPFIYTDEFRPLDVFPDWPISGPSFQDSNFNTAPGLDWSEIDGLNLGYEPLHSFDPSLLDITPFTDEIGALDDGADWSDPNRFLHPEPLRPFDTGIYNQDLFGNFGSGISNFTTFP